MQSPFNKTQAPGDNSFGIFPILIVVVLAGIGAIVPVLRNRPPRGPSHLHRREL